jgi:hypothetical protein
VAQVLADAYHANPEDDKRAIQGAGSLIGTGRMVRLKRRSADFNVRRKVVRGPVASSVRISPVIKIC